MPALNPSSDVVVQISTKGMRLHQLTSMLEDELALMKSLGDKRQRTLRAVQRGALSVTSLCMVEGNIGRCAVRIATAAKAIDALVTR